MSVHIREAEKEALLLEKEKTILENYIEGLCILQKKYDDKEYLSLIDDLRNNEYIQAFIKSSEIARKRGVPATKILITKEDIDGYFQTK